MRISLLLIILSALLVSCEHIEEDTPEDQIFYYNFEPEPYFSVIDSLIFLSYYDHCVGPCINGVIRSPDHSYYFDVDLMERKISGYRIMYPGQTTGPGLRAHPVIPSMVLAFRSNL